MMMNLDLDAEKQVTIGHGIDHKSIPENIKTKDDLKDARLLDPDCKACQASTDIYDIHPPLEHLNAHDKINKTSIDMEWVTTFACAIEDRIREVGYTKGWWNE